MDDDDIASAICCNMLALELHITSSQEH